MEKPEGDNIFQTPERAVGKGKVRLVPDCYILPRRSIPRTIALYSFLTMAGVGAGMLVEGWIKQQVERLGTISQGDTTVSLTTEFQCKIPVAKCMLGEFRFCLACRYLTRVVAWHSHYPTTVTEIYEDWKGRRAGLLKALTIEALILREKCDPNCGHDLSLAGFPDGTWTVTKSLPWEFLRMGLPEPYEGLNYARKDMRYRDWLEDVAFKSDVWLKDVATYFAVRNDFSNLQKQELLSGINQLPFLIDEVRMFPRR